MFDKNKRYIIDGLTLKKTIVIIKRFITLNPEYADKMKDLIKSLLMLDEVYGFNISDDELDLDSDMNMSDLSNDEIRDIMIELEDELNRTYGLMNHREKPPTTSLEDICKELNLLLPSNNNGQSPKK